MKRHARSDGAPEWPWILGPLLLGIALRLWVAAHNSGLTMDSPLYVRMSEALAGGHAPVLGPAHYGYPALVAAARLVVPGREWPGRVVSLVASLALVALVYRLARQRLTARWSSLAATLVAVHPLLAAYGGAIMTEAAFLAIATLGLLLAERRLGFGAGLALGAAYLVRPEAAVMALGIVAFGRFGWRGAARLLLGLVVVVGPYLGAMRIQQGRWELTPKAELVRPQFESRKAAEWRVGGGGAPAEPTTLVRRIAWAAPSIVSHYGPLLRAHAGRLLHAWPWPLALLSLVGLAVWRGTLLAPLLLLFVLPLLAVPLDVRFTQTLLPALAVGAAAGGSALARRWPGVRGAIAVLSVAAAAVGLLLCWLGECGARARHFDDGPMAPQRVAGEWLRRRGPADALVMDRKVYVPFFAGMRQIQLPDDDYDTIVRFAQRSGSRYLVLEEYAVNLRPQMMRLAVDPVFQARETRLRPVYLRRGAPHTGVAIFEVRPDSTAR